MVDLVPYVPLAVIALLSLAVVMVIRDKQIPNSVVAIGSFIAGAVFLLLFLIAETRSSLFFGLVMIGIGALALYRHLRGRARSGTPDAA